MKSICFVLLLLLASLGGHGQITSVWGQIGGGYLYDREFPVYDQLILRTGVALDLGRCWSVGVKTNVIFYRDLISPWQRAWQAGPFVRLGLPPAPRSRFYLESGLYGGNYRFYDNQMPTLVYQEPGLLYVSGGLGVEWRIWRNLFLDLGFHAYWILNRPSPRYAHRTYLIGLIQRIKDDRE
jgi:hypothetical protein